MVEIYGLTGKGGHQPVSSCNREEMGRQADACLDGSARRAWAPTTGGPDH